MEFLKREVPTTDIFCFQEMISTLGSADDDLFLSVARSLPDFRGFFEVIQDEENGVEVGLATFIKRTNPVEKEGDFFVYRTRNAMMGDDWRTLGRNVQFIQFSKSGKEYVVVNFHGLADGKGREDSPERIGQSEKLKEFLGRLGGAKIVVGDFNLTLATQSMSILDEGMRNLIRESGITSTRNRFFPYPDKFCDYILVDKSVKVNEFKAFPDEVSDHLALLLDFE